MEGSAYAAFKTLKAERRAQVGSSGAASASKELERAKAAQRSRQSRLTMSRRVEGERLDCPRAGEQATTGVEGVEPEQKQMTLEERWAAEDAAREAQMAAATPQPSGLAAVQPLMSKASAFLNDGQVAEARTEWESAKQILIAAEAVSPPLSTGGTGDDGTVHTHIEIPSAEEMMRQMQVTAARMVCMEGLMKCDLRLGRWKDAAEGATSMLAVAPRDADALLLRGRARASMSPPQTDEARKDFERVVRIGDPEQVTQAEQALKQLQRASVVRGRWRPSPELQAQLQGESGGNPAVPAANTPKFVLPLTVEAVSASGKKFRLFIIANSRGESPGDVWGGLQKPDGVVVKYEGGFDIETGALALKHVDTLIEGGATHAIQGKIVPQRTAVPSKPFELKYSQWWADITQIEGREGGREEYTWSCTLAPDGGAARTEYSTEFGSSKVSKAAKKYLAKLDAAPEPAPAPVVAADEPRPANLEEVFDMAKRLGLVTEQGVAMMRRNIARGRRSEAHFLKQWSERIDKELAERRAKQGLPEVDRKEVAATVSARKAREAIARKPVEVKVAAPGESIGVLFDELFGQKSADGGSSDQLEADMSKLLGGLRAESGVFGSSATAAKPSVEQRVEEARKEVLSNLTSRVGSLSSDRLAPRDGDDSSVGGEHTAWADEPEPEPDEAIEPTQQEDEDAAAEVVDEGAPPRWLLRAYGSPVVRGHALTDPEFDSLRVVSKRGGTPDASGLATLGRFEYRQGPMLTFPPSNWRGVVRRRPGLDSNGNPVFVLHPDVLDRADVLTMTAGDPAFDELQSQEFEVSLSGAGKVQLADKLLSKSIEYSVM